MSHYVIGAVLLAGLSAASIVWGARIRRYSGRLRLETEAQETDVSPPLRRPPKHIFRSPHDRATTVTHLLEQVNWIDNLQLEIIRAGWMLRPSELIVLCTFASIGLAELLLVLTRSGFMAVVGLVLGMVLCWGVLRSRQAARNRALSDQLPETLDMICSALRTGFAMGQAMTLVRAQMPPPISVEFGRVLDEVTFGRSLEEALSNLIVRTQNEDLELIVVAVQTQMALGGNLAEILNNIADMIRERVSLAREIAVASAEGKLSAYILLALPLLMGVGIQLINPGYLTPLLTNTLGHLLLGAGGLLMLSGALIIKRLVIIEL